MNVSPGIICEWTCTPDFLRVALRQIEKNGSRLIAITPKELNGVSHGCGRYVVTHYNVLYKNPAWVTQ